MAKIMHISSIQGALSLLFACGANNYDKQMLGHKQKLFRHVPGCAGAWLRHCTRVFIDCFECFYLIQFMYRDAFALH